jgi:hypothetical protein
MYLNTYVQQFVERQ